MSSFHFLVPDKIKTTPHYHGDIVRRLFMTAAAVMIISLPFVYQDFPVSLFLFFMGAVIYAVVAGMTNPALRSVAVIDVVASGAGFVIFEFLTLVAYQQFGIYRPIFYVTQLLAFILLAALYFSVKMMRKFLMPIKNNSGV